MKKIIRSLLANFAVVSSTAPLMANQVTRQDIENLKTKVALWEEKTRNWDHYLEKEFTEQITLFERNNCRPNNYQGYFEELDNIQTYQTRGVTWFDRDICYYPQKIINFNCKVTTTQGSLINEFQMNDYLLVNPEHVVKLPKTPTVSRIFVKTFLNNYSFDVKVSVIIPYLLQDLNEIAQILDSREQQHHVASNFNHQNVKIAITGTVVYRLSEEITTSLHNEVLAIQNLLLNPPISEEQSYWDNIDFMNLV